MAQLLKASRAFLAHAQTASLAGSRSLLRAAAPVTSRRTVMTEETARERDATLVSRYNNMEVGHSAASLDLDSVLIEPQEVGNMVQPTVSVGTVPGLELVTPFAVTGFNRFQKMGDFGTTRTFNGVTIRQDDVTRSRLELMLTDEPLLAQEGAETQEQVTQLFDWLDGLRNKLMDHIAENLDEYPVIRDRHKYLATADEATRRSVMDSMVTRLIRDVNFNDRKARAITIRNDVYGKAKDTSSIRVGCTEDQEAAELGYYRRFLPVFNAAGERLSLDEMSIRPGDVAAATLKIRPYIYQVGGNVGVKIEVHVGNVIIGRARAKAQSSDGDYTPPASPFGDLTH